VLISGTFTTVNDTNRNCIARLNANGSLDSSFKPGAGPNDLSLAVSPYKRMQGAHRGWVHHRQRHETQRIARSMPTASAAVFIRHRMNGAISSVAVQPDGKVLIGGPFTFINGTNRYGNARLNADAVWTALSFRTASIRPDRFYGTALEVAAIALQSDGKVLVVV